MKDKGDLETTCLRERESRRVMDWRGDEMPLENRRKKAYPGYPPKVLFRLLVIVFNLT